MHFAAIFVMQICVTHKRNLLHKRETTEYNSWPQSILVLVVKYRHHANVPIIASEYTKLFLTWFVFFIRYELEKELDDYETEQRQSAQFVEQFSILTSEKVENAIC